MNITVGDIDETYGDDTKGYITKLFEIDEMCIDNPRLAEQKLNTKLDKFPSHDLKSFVLLPDNMFSL